MIAPNKTGKCPHCGVGVRFEEAVVHPWQNDPLSIPRSSLRFVTGNKCYLNLIPAGCPGCSQLILTALDRGVIRNDIAQPLPEILDLLLWPDAGARDVPWEVEEQAPELAADFREAACVLPKSKKASAALSRRCLQFILREKGGTKSRDLSKQINEVLDDLPSELGSNVDAIRQIGNFAAHPVKATNSGEIADVEEGEAEWLLDILEDLFDYYYVAPAKSSARRDALNQKLVEHGKPSLKTPSC